MTVGSVLAALTPSNPEHEKMDVNEFICCTQEHDGDDPFCIREFHISMRHFAY